MRVWARGFSCLATVALLIGAWPASSVFGATAPGKVRNLSVVVASVDRGTGDASLTVAFDAASTGGPTDHYQIDECTIAGGSLSCTTPFVSEPDVPAGPAHVVVPGIACAAGVSTCVIRVRGVDSTSTLFSTYTSASSVPWAPYGVTATSGPAAGQVTLQFNGPSESGANGSRHYTAYVCRTGCGSDANWSDSGLTIPFPPAGSAPYSTTPYDCGAGVTCQFRMQFVDGAGAPSTLSGPIATAVGPTLTIDRPAPGAVTNDPTVSGTCASGLGTVTATVNPGAHMFTSPCSGGGTWSVSIVSLPDASYSASASQPPLAAGPVSFTYDSTAPVTTDDTAAIGSGWHTAPVTVTLSPGDNLSGVAATYYTTNGSTPTTGSANGTSINLTADGVYTIKYFSVDVAGNAEAVKTAGTQIRVDQNAPTITMIPANGARVSHDGWLAECATPGVCGSVTDATSGVSTIGPATVRRLSDGFYWNGSAFKAPVANAPITGAPSAYSIALPVGKLDNGVSYTVTMHATDVAGNAATTTSTFTYDNTKPSPVSVATANHDGAVAIGDRFAVTFSEPIDPSTIPATGVLTMSRSSNAITKYDISGLTSGPLATGATGYVTAGAGSRAVTYNGTLSVSSSTVTFTVTSACTSGCAFATTGAPAGTFTYKAAPTIEDFAGNQATTTTVSTGPVVIF